MNRQMKTMRIATQKRARSIGENGTCGGHGKNRDITTGEFDRKIDHAHRVNYQFLTLCTFQGEGGGDKEWKGSQGEGDEKRGEREGERERKDPRSPPVTSSSSSSSSSLSFFFSLDRSHPLWWQWRPPLLCRSRPRDGTTCHPLCKSPREPARRYHQFIIDFYHSFLIKFIHFENNKIIHSDLFAWLALQIEFLNFYKGEMDSVID